MQLPTELLSSGAIENITKWLTEPKYSEYKAELESLIESGEWKALEDAFFQVIEFGTGGRRGKTGIGSNRINKITVGESAQALCEYASSFDSDAATKGIVIAFDTRITSPELSRVAAEVVVANGFKVYIFNSFRSTPELSFAVRHLGCAAGIVISASHNPPSDNGFKAYWSDGGQLVSPHDKGVLAMAEKVTEIKTTNYNKAVTDGKINVIGREVDDAYIAAASAEALGTDREIAIVYSPLHGTGQTNVLPVLREVGFQNISPVISQMVPDGNFPTIPSGKPNPEEKEANDLAVAQLLSEFADIAITNDPDADRIGVMVRQPDNSVIYLSGNQSAILAVDYSLKKLKARNELTPNNYIAKTIVTTDMLNVLANYYGVKIYDNMLIGFKYIGELIGKKENTNEKFIIGGEESYGLLKGTYARDKDSATGALPLAEYAAELKKGGKTLYDRLLELYMQHGLYAERLNEIRCTGPTGFDQMQRIMEGLRKSAKQNVGEHSATAILDYLSLERTDIASGQVTPIDCQSGNVIVLEFGDTRNRITIRPSGTEPKLKFYIQWYRDYDKSQQITIQYADLEDHLDSLSKNLGNMLLEI
jgi:phosphomannomutase